MSALPLFVSFVINLLITNSPLKCRWELAEFLLHPRPRCLVPIWLLFHSSGLDSAEERNRTDETEAVSPDSFSCETIQLCWGSFWWMETSCVSMWNTYLEVLPLDSWGVRCTSPQSLWQSTHQPSLRPARPCSGCPLHHNSVTQFTEFNRNRLLFFTRLRWRNCSGLSHPYQYDSVVGLLQFGDAHILAYVHIAIETAAWVLGCLRECVDDVLRTRIGQI